MADDTPPSNTVLLDLAQTLGRIEGQNQLILMEQARAAESRKDQYEALEEIRTDVHDVRGKVTSVTDKVQAIEPDVRNMKAFRVQLGVAVVVVTSAVTGAINLIWLGLTHINEIRSALREFLR